MDVFYFLNFYSFITYLAGSGLSCIMRDFLLQDLLDSLGVECRLQSSGSTVRLSYCTACRILFLQAGMKLSSHCQQESKPLDHQGGPDMFYFSKCLLLKCLIWLNLEWLGNWNSSVLIIDLCPEHSAVLISSASWTIEWTCYLPLSVILAFHAASSCFFLGLTLSANS